MPNRRKAPSVRHTKRVSRDMRDSTIGTHVERSSRSGRSSQAQPIKRAARGSSRGSGVSAHGIEPQAEHHRRGPRNQYVASVQHRARTRRIGLGIVVVLVVLAIAVGAGFLAFRGSVGSEMSLRDSDASRALVSVRSDEPYYALIAVELGAVAEPLEHAGPDVLLLARVDRQSKELALIGVPAALQVSTDGGMKRVADLATKGDAALIEAVANFAKVDISHYVKIDKGGLEGIVDTFGGVEVDVDQVIDDPHAGDVYLPTGAYTLNGASALTYLRADNLRMGATDQLQHQVDFAALLLQKLFSNEGRFATRIDSIDSYFQTDLSLGDLEALQAAFGGMSASSVIRTVLPGYLTEVTGVANEGDALYIGSANDMAAIIESLEAGQTPDVASSSDAKAADPSSFTVEVQNGTNITGAAGVTADLLTKAGFNVVKSGNAEQPVYDETLIVYKGSEGPGRAKAVVDALGFGRAISGEVYYSFEPDVLVIVGADYKPFV